EPAVYFKEEFLDGDGWTSFYALSASFEPFLNGTWIHPEIDNPEYSPDSIDGTIFDNFLITNDEAYAEE
uniref:CALRETICULIN=RUBELLA virus RNA binding protein (Fragments) n=1 Tax=Macaca mulatta TaxID=9544 RepID=Q9TS71_MACMU